MLIYWSSKSEDFVEDFTRDESHLSYGVDWAKCARSTLQHGGMDGGTAAVRPAGGTGGTDCPKSGGSSPMRNKNS